MAKCGDCLYFGFCKKYVDPEETFPEIDGGCHVFKNKDAFVEVVRCKACIELDRTERFDHLLSGTVRFYCPYSNGYVPLNHFCSYGERKDNG